MVELSNPRMEASFEDWPHGRQRVTANFVVESNNRGERVSRTTTGKPKKTTYYLKARIVDGNDGKTYILAYTSYGFFSVVNGTMKGSQSIFEGQENFNEYKKLLGV